MKGQTREAEKNCPFPISETNFLIDGATQTVNQLCGQCVNTKNALHFLIVMFLRVVSRDSDHKILIFQSLVHLETKYSQTAMPERVNKAV